MPTIQLPGFPGGITVSDAQYAQYVAQGIIPAPTPIARSSNVTTGRDPCQIYEDAKRMGQPAAILAVLKSKCDVFKQAQAFAASPAMPASMPAPMTEPMPMTMAPPETFAATAPEAPMDKTKLILLGVGGVALVGLAAYLVSKK